MIDVLIYVFIGLVLGIVFLVVFKKISPELFKIAFLPHYDASLAIGFVILNCVIWPVLIPVLLLVIFINQVLKSLNII